MAEEPKIAIQGSIQIQKMHRSPGFTGLVSPTDNPEGWYIEVFSTMSAAEAYAKKYSLSLAIVKEEEEE